jgi:hypothetical protein
MPHLGIWDSLVQHDCMTEMFVDSAINMASVIFCRVARLITESMEDPGRMEAA